MDIFRVHNKAHCGCWVVAPDVASAKVLALQAKHARKIENLTAEKVTADILADVAATGAQEIVSGNKTGFMVRRISGYTFDEVVAGVKKPGPRWELVEIQ
jgi:3-hydroxyacyl-CoA dehydrogenase